MNKESSGLPRFTNAVKSYPGILITISTGVAYVASIVFQQSYLGYYGVDSTLVNVKLDATSIMNGGVMILGAAVMVTMIFWIVNGFMNLLFTKDKVLNLVIADILVVLMGVACVIILQTNSGHLFGSDNEIDKIVLTIGAITVASYTIIKPLYIWVLVKKRGNSLKESYLKASHYRVIDKKYKFIPRNAQTWILVGLVIATGAIALPAEVASETVESKTNYSYIEDDSQSTTKNVIVMNSADGYVVVKYNTKKEQFENTYKIMDYKGEMISSMKVKPIKAPSPWDFK